MSVTKVFVGNTRVELIKRCQTLPDDPEIMERMDRDLEVSCSTPFLKQVFQAAREGCTVGLVSRLGRDLAGDAVIRLMRQHEINTTFVNRAFNCDTPKKLRVILPNSEVTRTGYMDPRCRVTVEDVLRAQALLFSADQVIVDSEVSQEVREALVGLAKRFAVPFTYDQSDQVLVRQQVRPLDGLFRGPDSV